ncbi:MAG TPA: hypothetical protein VE439_01140 [Anaerolineae bacterium]|jgi:hypothetical protein|nr:hypothetical protein [Anaerolineae bacterium]
MANKRESGKSALDNYRNSIKETLFSERSAYGFTLVISGSVLLVVNKYGVPAADQVFIFALGALIAFAILVFFSFGGFGRPIEMEDVMRHELPWGLIHFISVLGALGAAYLTLIVSPRSIAAGVVSGTATLLYNLLLGLEYIIASAGRPEEEQEGEEGQPGGRVIPFIRRRLRR